MYRKKFEAAADFIRSLGWDCSIHDRSQLSHSDIDNLSARLGCVVPNDLVEYLLELGDGFSMDWEIGDWHTTGHLFSAGLSFLDDIVDGYTGMQEDLQGIIASVDTKTVVREEALRRLAWVPIEGVGEGGYMFCLDSASSPNRITYYDIRWESYSPENWCSSIADSLPDLIDDWSRFCSSDPMTARGPHVSHSSVTPWLTGPFHWLPIKNLA